MRIRVGQVLLLNCLALLSATLTHAADQAPRWEAIQTVQAEEAIQAAAADERFFYAINNSSIARYDRQSGERLAVSTGQAHHLNSGFLWQGKLYCAHSNYPKKPEQSEIKVLNLETMELSTFHDFGNFGGSLTWAIRAEDSWWCNFAHYGADNARTFLVQFDQSWNELGRWTYPPELIAKLGNYSLSGGIWHDDVLLVTGHDDQVLYELRIPKTGQVLELLGSVKAPFTGQGIAFDLQSGGLVGINRAKREILLAQRRPAEPLRIRVLSYNIHHGEGVDGKLDLDRLAKVMLSVKPDIVAIQEVDQNTQRTGKVDQPAELARLTQLKSVFGGNLKFQGGLYGNVLLSRFPIVSWKNHQLPKLRQGEERGVIEAELQLPGQQKLRFYATHFDYRPEDLERVASAKLVNELLAKQENPLAILAGDLNDVPQSATLKELAKHWTSSHPADQPTWPAEKPTQQIDYILFTPAARWKVIEAEVLEEAVASDHRAIFSVLEVQSLEGEKTRP